VQRGKSTNPPLTFKTGIVWFGNHTRSNGTNTHRSRRSREFSLVTPFAEKEKWRLSVSDTIRKVNRMYFISQILHNVIASGTAKSLRGEANSSRSSAYDEFASSFLLAMTIS